MGQTEQNSIRQGGRFVLRIISIGGSFLKVTVLETHESFPKSFLGVGMDYRTEPPSTGQ